MTITKEMSPEASLEASEAANNAATSDNAPNTASQSDRARSSWDAACGCRRRTPFPRLRGEGQTRLTA